MSPHTARTRRPAPPAARTLPVPAPRPSAPPVWLPTRDVQLLVDGPQIVPAVTQAISAARQVVDISLFSLLPFGSGAQLAKLLEAKARQGVEVNVLLDYVGSAQVPGTPMPRLVATLRRAGVHVHMTKPFPLSRDPQARYVDHRKIVVVDGHTAFVGGMNFTGLTDSWHDLMLRFGGVASAQAGAVFAKRWHELGGTISARQRHSISRPARATSVSLPDSQESLALLMNAPERDDMAITRYYLDRINSATRRVWLVTPFIGDQRVVDALAAAARRGVDVRVATSGKPIFNVPLIRSFTRSFYDDLMAAGAHVYEIDATTHAKALLTDGEAAVSSYNVSRRAADHDLEIAAVTHTPAHVAQVEQLFRHDFGTARMPDADMLDRLSQRAVDLIVDGLGIQY